MSPSSPFYATITNSSSSRITLEQLALILLHSLMWTEKELMEWLSATKSELRNLKTLDFYFHHIQLKIEASLGFSHLTKEDYYELKSQPLRWFGMDHKFQKELDYYLNSSNSETSVEISSDEIKREPKVHSLSLSSSCPNLKSFPFCNELQDSIFLISSLKINSITY